jgi:hypothetical protein
VRPADLLTVNQIARAAGVTPAAVRKWIVRPVAFPLPWWTGDTGDPHLYLRSEVEAWLEKTGRL